MLFNSINFVIFFSVIFIIYWKLPNQKVSFQNILLLLASYFFYACWDWRFLFLLIFSTFLDYYIGIKLSQRDAPKKFWFWLSIIINLGFLGFFKYFNFFVDSFAHLMATFGLKLDTWTLNIILPIGISFYTFHGLSYIIDIYKGKIKAEKNIVDYSLFVGFFPLLVAGPIERATHLLPQIKKSRNFDYVNAVDGLKQILWGLFKKVVIADGCAEYANMVFNHSADYSGSSIALGTLLFSFQIYGDFSGYSDIALGTARLLGFDLLRNFNFPYFSRDIAEFWRRWHISLTTWFRDYLYIPLGGSRGNQWKQIRNTFIVFIISGLWHGANWTFIFWGLLNALYFIPLLLTNNNRNNLNIVAEGKILPSLKEFSQMLITFCLVVFAWIFFRAENLSHAFECITKIFSKTFFSIPEVVDGFSIINTSFLVLFFLAVEWFGREYQYAIQGFFKKNKLFRWAFYYVLIALIFLFSGMNQQFIYFQF